LTFKINVVPVKVKLSIRFYFGMKMDIDNQSEIPYRLLQNIINTRA